MRKIASFLRRHPPKAPFYPHRWSVRLKPESLSDFIVRSAAVPVDSADALAAGSAGGARAWIIPGAESAPDYSRILSIDGYNLFASARDKLERPSIARGYLRMSSAVVFPQAGLLMSGEEFILLTEARDWVDINRLMPGFLAFEDGGLIAKRSRLRPVRGIGRPLLNICQAHHQNYSHWLLSNLPWIMPWLGHLQGGRLAVLTPPLRGAWQRRTLELLGVPPPVIVEAMEHAVRCDDLIQPGRCYPERAQQGAVGVAGDVSERRWFAPPERAVVRTVEALKAAVRPSAHVERPERIYISRRETKSFRTLVNEAEIEAAAERLGFRIVRTEEHSFDDQVAMFSRARVVIGPHGAGMTNAAFAPPGCLVCDFFPAGWINDWSLRLTQLFGHRYLALSFPDRVYPQAARIFPAIGKKFAYRIVADELTRVISETMRSVGL